MNNTELKERIEDYKIIAIVRKVYGNDLVNLAQALSAGGIQLLEITFDQADPGCIQKTSDAIRMLNQEMNGDMVFGAGTVLTVLQAEAALSAGARYIVSPNTDEQVIHYSKQNDLIVIPGAMTPTEMVNAVYHGADYVKVFPVSDLGLRYMKSIMAPLNHIKFVATGGVSLNNLADMFKIGFVAAGIGGLLVDKKLISSGDFIEITNTARKYVEIAQNVANE